MADPRRAIARVRAAARGRRVRRHARVALTPPPPSAFAAFGEGSLIVPPGRVESPHRIRIGARVIIHEHGWLCVQERPGGAVPTLVIADDVSLNRFAKIVCHDSVRIESGVVFADRVYVSDVEHEPTTDGPPRLTAPRPVVIGADSFVGVGAIIKPGVTLGAGAYVGAAAVVTEDVPAHSVVVGNPARVVRRRDEASGEWRPA